MFLLLLTIILMLAGTGCNKVLNVPGNAGAQIITSQVFVDSLNAAAGVVGLYGNGSIMTSGVLEGYTAMSSDVAIGTSSPKDMDFYTDLVLPGTPNLPGDASILWSTIYGSHGIFGANAAIEAINNNTDSALSANARNQLIGECKVLRAVGYFTLVNLFGGVPLVLSTDWKTTSQIPRASADAVCGSRMSSSFSAPSLLWLT